MICMSGEYKHQTQKPIFRVKFAEDVEQILMHKKVLLNFVGIDYFCIYFFLNNFNTQKKKSAIPSKVKI